MKIEAVDILQMRNMAVPRQGKKRLPVPDHGYSAVVQITLSQGRAARHIGLGEIRALSSLTGESPDRAFVYARTLGRLLVGAELPDVDSGRDAARMTAQLVQDRVRSFRGIAASDPLPEDRHPSVHFAFDCALIDALASAAGTSVAGFFGAEKTPVRRNAFARSFKKPNALLNKLLRGNMPDGWLRGNYARNGAMLATVMGAIAAATNGKEGALKGVWFDLNGRWKFMDARTMIDGLTETPLVRNSDLGIILEQPFPSHSSQWYADLFDLLSQGDAAFTDRVRIMIEDEAHSLSGIESLARILPKVDLKITPQKCGSIDAFLTVLDRARELGFGGQIYLGNAGMNTELNTIVLTVLAQIVGDGVLFSANRKEDTIRQVYPQVGQDSDDPCLLIAPEGPGWGTALCKSGLSKRLRRYAFLRSGDITPDTESLKELLLLRAFDDSQRSPSRSLRSTRKKRT